MRRAMILTAAACLAGCAHRYERTVQRFRDAQDRGDTSSARALMGDDPRRWFESREGAGIEWRIGGEPGAWAGWDDEFNSESDLGAWEIDESQRCARVLVTEINDYYRLTERGPQQNRQTWWFDEQGRIVGWMIEAIRGDGSMGRTDEFLAWAETHEPVELAYLRPEGRIDPTGDRPARTRALLERWRAAVGLPPIR